MSRPAAPEPDDADPQRAPEADDAPAEDEEGGSELAESPAAGVLDPDLDAPPEPGEPG